jgi:hypothetical protein
MRLLMVLLLAQQSWQLGISVIISWDFKLLVIFINKLAKPIVRLNIFVLTSIGCKNWAIPTRQEIKQTFRRCELHCLNKLKEIVDKSISIQFICAWKNLLKTVQNVQNEAETSRCSINCRNWFEELSIQCSTNTSLMRISKIIVVFTSALWNRPSHAVMLPWNQKSTCRSLGLFDLCHPLLY